MIYFIKNRSDGRIKIGTPIRLSQRLKQLMAEHGDLEILAVTDGNLSEEKGFHRRFSHLRAFGEWFEPGDDLLGFVVSEGKPWDGSDEVPAKRYGTLIRVSDRFAESLRQAASFEQLSAAEYCDSHLMPIVEKRYKDAVLREAKKIEGKS